jgi:hypothetical protein
MIFGCTTPAVAGKSTAVVVPTNTTLPSAPTAIAVIGMLAVAEVRIRVY